MNGIVTGSVGQEKEENRQSQGGINGVYPIATPACENASNREVTIPSTVENSEQIHQSVLMNGIQDINPRVVINVINQHLPQNIHQEYRNSDRDILDSRQFFIPQMQQQQPNSTRSKAIQVDHVEEQCVTRRSTFSGKYLLCIEETERPVYVNNYYTGDNPQYIFREVGQKYSKK